nr:copia protein [Tanacetum cinerariifolium]
MTSFEKQSTPPSYPNLRSLLINASEMVIFFPSTLACICASPLMFLAFVVVQNCSMHEVILNGDSPIPTRIIKGVVQPVAPTTTEQRLARKNELMARGTLLMVLPDKHQLKFNIHKDAKTLMEAIEKYQLESLGESLSQEDINLKFLRSLPTEWRTHTLIWRNKTDLADQSLDDLFNSLKIYEAEVKISSSASTSTQNIAFVSSQNTDSTKEPVSAVVSVSATSAKVFVFALPNVDTFSNRTGRNLSANGTTSMGFDMSKVECYNYHTKGHFARECSMMVWAAMTKAFRQKKNQPTMPSWLSPPQVLPVLIMRQKFEKAKQKRDELKLKLEKFQTSSKNLSQLLASQTNDKTGLGNKNQVSTSSMFDCDEMFSFESDVSMPASPVYDRYQSGEGYHAVPPPYTGTFMPPKPNLVFHDAPNVNETIHTSFNVKLSPTKPEKDLSIIEDWVSNSEDESEADPSQNDPSFVQPAEQVKTPRPSIKPDEHSILAVNQKTDIPNPKSHGNSKNRKACFVLLTKSKLVPLTAVRLVTTDVPHNNVTRPRPAKTIVTNPYSPPRRNINRRPSPKPSNFPLNVTTVKASKFNAVKGVQGNWGNPQHALKDKGVIDSGCSRHMTGNMSYLFDFEEINGGYVAFGRNPKGGKISGKDTECIVLSPDFKLPDENQVLLRVPKENNMFNVDLKNIVPSGDLTCLFKKATLDESNLWHRRLGHINFKTMNKLVKEWVLVTKPHNKTLYELLLGRTPSIGFMRPFGCSMTILNTLDPLGKFDRKDNEGFLVRYSNTVDDATFEVKEPEFEGKKPESEIHVSPSSSAKTKKHDDKTKREANGKSHVELSIGFRNLSVEFKDFFDNSINEVNAAGTPVPAVGPTHGKSSYVDTSQYPDDLNMLALEDITYSDDEEDVGAEANFTNLETNITGSPVRTTRVHKDHHVTQIIGDLSLATQTKSMTRTVKDQGGLSQINNKDFHTCMFACFLSQEEPKRVHQALKDPSWIEAMQEELLQFKMQKEEGIDYKEVFDPVAKIEVIRLFLGNASFMGFMVYQMDVKSAIMYGTIEEEVYVCQPLAFEDPDHPDKVYVDDIIFGSTNKDLCKDFEKLIKDKFHMSLMGELTFFLGLQVKQKPDGIFISQDKYLAKILRKFGLTDGKSGSTPIDIEKPLLKDPDGEDVDFVHVLISKLHPKFHTYMQSRDSPFNLVAYSDSDYASASLDRKSTTGGYQFLGYRLISWQCKKQTLVATSSPKAEYVATASCCAQVLWIQNQLLDYGAQVSDLSSHTTKYSYPVLTQKVSENMRRVGKGFSEVKTPLFEGMLVPQQAADAVDDVVAESVPTDDVDDDVPATDVEPTLLSPPPTTTLLPPQEIPFTSQVVPTLPPSPISQLSSPPQQQQPSQPTTISMDLLNNLLETCSALTRRVENLEQDKIAQALEITKLKQRVKRLEKKNKLKVSGLRRLRKVGTTQRIESSADTVMDDQEDASKQREIIANIDANKDVTLKDVVAVAKEVEVEKDANVQGRLEESQAKFYHIDLEHVDKVFSMQDDEPEPAELQEVIEVVTTAKLMTEVVTAATITAATTPIIAVTTPIIASTITAALSATRKRKGMVIRDPEETATPSTIIHSEPKSKDKGKGIMVQEPKPLKKQARIEQNKAFARELEAELNKNINWEDLIELVQKKKKEDNVVLRYQALKRKPQTEAQAKKNMMIYLKNMARFKIDYFKGMSYDAIHPIFEKYFNSNVAILEKSTKELEEEESRALKRKTKSSEEKAAKKQKLDEEVEELKKHLQIVSNDDDDVYTEAIPLALKVPVVDYEIHTENNKPYYKIIRADGTHQLFLSFLSLLRNFDREDLEMLWQIVKERFASSKPKNFSDDFLLTTLIYI